MGKKTQLTVDTVLKIGEKLPGTEVATAYGSPALKVNSRMYACVAINKAAEPNSLVVYVADFEQRDALLAEAPDIYYTKPHYEAYPVVLVRLARVTRDALEDLLLGAHRIVSRKPPARPSSRTRKGK